jgi:hypothetical protein
MKRNDAHRRGLKHYAGKRIVGKQYRPSCGRCDVPPWEVCGCSSDALLSLNARIVEPVMIERRDVADLFNAEARERFNFALQE